MRSFLMIALLALLVASTASAAPNPYERIERQAQAEEVLKDVLGTLGKSFNLRLRTPVQIHLVPGQTLDAMLSKGPYKGAEVGLYTGLENGRHQVYVMQSWPRDVCAGITAHELTHAWQQENTPPNQDLVLSEGFAKWVEYRYYDLIGAYTYSDQIRNTADPVYGVGFFAVQDVEDAVGASKVADVMRGAVHVNDLPRKEKGRGPRR